MDKNVLSTVNNGPMGPMGPNKQNGCAYSILRNLTETEKKQSSKATIVEGTTIQGTVRVQADSKAPEISAEQPAVINPQPKPEIVKQQQESVVTQHQETQQQNFNKKSKVQKREERNNQEQPM